jgi:DNA topoisomerase-1
MPVVQQCETAGHAPGCTRQHEGYCAAVLHFVTDDEPGIARRGTTRFRYVDETSGATVSDAAVLARIRSIAVPPAWHDVWISADPDGHIQATGRDAKGRKQYRYHPDFRRRRDRRKFHQLIPFGTALGSLRSTLDDDLRRGSLSRDRVVAAVVSLLERTYVRVGNEAYAKTNKSYGLTTLRCAHADLDGSRLRLHFTGKAGKQFDVTCCDPRLARVVRRCQELPGQLLFQYLDGDEPVRITSSDVNDYLRRNTGLDATAKTFRTWGGTLLAAQQLVAIDVPDSSRAAASAIKEALEPVSAQLGNTIAVCRASYVHPKVLSLFETGRLTGCWDAGPKRDAAGLRSDERRLLHVLAHG